jgi:hypothetical protein
MASVWGVPAALGVGGAIAAVGGLAAFAWLRRVGVPRPAAPDAIQVA